MYEITSSVLKELSTFSGREAELRRVKRWGMWKPVFYRSHLHSHGKRIAWLVETVAPILSKAFGPTFDIRRTVTLALVHDDPEIITGDYQAGNKAKMTAEQLAAIDEEERRAIATLSERFPKTVGNFIYRELQEDIQDLRIPEARVAKFLDVFDGFGEGIHELFAGNKMFTEQMVNEFGEIPLFDKLNLGKRQKMMEKYPDLAQLKDTHVFFELATLPDWQSILPTRSLHTRMSLEEETGYQQYDKWKKVVINSGDSEEIENLYTQQEFA